MVGSVISPMVTVVAPTTPLAAASSVPTIDDRNAKPAAQRAEQPAHGLEQFLGDARALQHHAHEDEHRDGEQHLVGHHAIDAPRQRAEEGEAHRAGEMAERGEGERDAAERQRHRIAGEQQAADGDHHQDGEDFGERHDQRPPRSTCAARIACDTPCSAISSANSGISVLSRNTAGMPLVSRERSRIAHERAT